jgi:hypothetical protein
VKQEITHHLLPLLIILIIIEVYWIFRQVPYPEFIFLTLGFTLGSFLLDIDHFIFWFYRKPNLEESRLAQIAFRRKDIRSLIKLSEITNKKHYDLIFHHYFFQIALVFITFFVFTSSNSTFAKAMLLALNLHLLIDEINDYFYDKKTLQKWLFARESRQLSIDSIKYYLMVFIILLFTFTILLLQSKP